MKTTLLFLVVCVFIFGTSCNPSNEKKNKQKQNLQVGSLLVLSNLAKNETTGFTIRIPDGIPLPTRISYNENFPKLKNFLQNLGIVSKAHASENEWAFVRQSALWANNNTDAIEAIIGPIKKYNLLNTVNSLETQTQLPSGTFKVKLTVNANDSISASAYNGNKIFKHKFEMWRVSDSRKALEMFFDNVDSLAANSNGVILKYNLNVLDPATYPDDLVCETYASVTNVSYQGKTVPSQKQTISWSGPPSVFYFGSLGGRVVLELMDNGTVLCFKSVVRFQHNNKFTGCGTTGDEYYYALAYSQFFTTGDKKATAKMSLKKNSIDNTDGKICGYYSRNYGLFFNQGFVSDSNSASQVPSDYPQTSRVDTLFGTIGTSGVGTWDDLSQSKLASLNIQFSFQ